MTVEEFVDFVVKTHKRGQTLVGLETLFFPDGELSGPPAKGRVSHVIVGSHEERAAYFFVDDASGKRWEVRNEFVLLPDSEGGYEI